MINSNVDEVIDIESQKYFSDFEFINRNNWIRKQWPNYTVGNNLINYFNGDNLSLAEWRSRTDFKCCTDVFSRYEIRSEKVAGRAKTIIQSRDSPSAVYGWKIISLPTTMFTSVRNRRYLSVTYWTSLNAAEGMWRAHRRKPTWSSVCGRKTCLVLRGRGY